MKKIFMGWDSREWLAYNVASASILRRSTLPELVIQPLVRSELKPLLARPIEVRDGKLWCPISQAPMATEFAISRFCVPFLQRDGWALFVDCDILCLRDIADLFALADPRYAVMCVKHPQKPKAQEETKMDGQIQTFYARKNWSSVVLWNCSHRAHERLTAEALNTWPGRDLHAFKWLGDDEIGALPSEWNFLVGVSPMVRTPIAIAHFTLGGPWLRGWPGGPMDDLWKAELNPRMVA